MPSMKRCMAAYHDSAIDVALLSLGKAQVDNLGVFNPQHHALLTA